MARILASSCLSMQHNLSSLPTSFLTFTAIFTVFSAVIFLCGGHEGLMSSLKAQQKMKTVRLGGEKKKKQRVMDKLKSSKALLMNKMISWRKVDEEDDQDVDNDAVVWKKTIIKGEKCRPLDFSGKILYDADGNLLSD